MATTKVLIGNVKGPKGDQGVEGPQGPQGTQGTPGKDGAGVPDGGSTGQVLAKASGDNQATKWIDVYTKNEVDAKVAPIQEYVDSAKKTQEITLGTTWSDNTQTVSVTGIKATDRPMIVPKYTGSVDEMQKQKDEWNKVIKADSGEGNITFTTSSDTTLSLTLIVKGV